jgi:polysaccharide chain length determinant protein (PEP-CTERM system associated)
MNDELLDKLKTFVTEAFLHRKSIVLFYTVISLAILALGLNWPTYYVSYATIMVDNNSVIKPLMEGAAVPTDINEHARIARDLIFSRKLLDKVAESYLSADHQGPLPSREEIITTVQKKAEVSSSKDNLIMVNYKDDDPEQAMHVAQLLAETYITESINLKIQEGKSVYDFIDKQVQEYAIKLSEIEKQLNDLRNANIDITSRRVASDKLDKLDQEIEKTQKELVEKNLTKSSLENQLAGESMIIEDTIRDDQNLKRLADLQTQLDTLRLSYHDSYPDIKQIRNQIEDIKALLEKEKAEKNNTNSTAENRTSGNRRSTINPIAGDLRRDLYKTQSEIMILNSRIEELERKKKEQIAKMPKIGDTEARESELKRDFEVTYNVYQDLLKKREQARVSMNLDREGQGKALRLYAPAFVPTKPQGLRFLYFLAFSQFAGLGLPLGILFLRLNFDNKIRSEMVIHEKLNLPLLGVVPHIYGTRESWKNKLSSVFVLILAMFNMGVLVTAVILYRAIL